VKRFLTILFIIMGVTAQAQEDSATALVGNDVFTGGYRIVHDTAGADDLFIGGNSIDVLSAVSGSVHMAGQSISIEEPVGGDVYSLGQSIKITAPVGGDVTVGGQDIYVNDIGGDLRATGASVEINGTVGGYAAVAGETVRIFGNIGGDLHLTGMNVEFGDSVTIGGTLFVYEDEAGAIDIPSNVDAGNLERLTIEEFPEETGFGFVMKSFLSGVIFVAIIAGLIAAIAPQRLAGMRESLLANPFRMLWIGFLGLSVIIGASIVSAMTIVGLILMPVLLLLAGIGGFLGYVIGAYSLGVGLRLLAGMPEPDTLAARGMAALIGALSVAIIALAPLVGWLFVMALTLSGVGVLIHHLFKPRFFAGE